MNSRIPSQLHIDKMQVMPSSPFLPGLLHQQYLARGIAAMSGPPPMPVEPTTPPSSEDNMSPPPRMEPQSSRSIDESYEKNQQTSNYDRERPRDFKCPLCGDNMTSLKEFTSHLRSHNEVKPTADPTDPTGQAKVYHCCLCGKMLSSFSSLDRHMLVHSGERPFSCEICQQTFTTNGNMHRHKRTHNIRDSCESDGSGGSSGKRARKRKAAPLSPAIEQSPCKKTESSTDASYAPLNCPICSEKFYSELSLEVHVISFHPGREIKCEDCGHPCPTYNYFKLHRNMFHFKFGSSNGFPSQTPFGSGLPLLMSGQEKNGRIPLILPSNFSPIKRDDHHAGDHDLKDFSAANDTSLNTSFCSDNGTDDDPVLREMKLKGEFPCRLCPSVFPNLRALKGHNKEHLLSPPYECNVGTCHYSTGDKSNLLQHMRTHTGQKPFECKICNFGFTTKANCERHVKNKHNKNTKEEVRDHILVQEGDDNETSPYSDLPRDGFRQTLLETSFEPDPIAANPSVFPPTPPRSSAFIPYRPFEVDNNNINKPEFKIEADDAPLDLSKSSTDPAPKTSNRAEHILDLTADAKDKVLISQQSTEQPTAPLPGSGFPFNLPFLQGTPAGSLWPPQLGLNGMNHTAFPFNTMHLAALLAAKNESLKKQAEAIQAKETAAALQNLSHIQDLASQRSLISQISPTSSSVSTNSPQNSPQKTSVTNDVDKYKMVIKNGILMRKQKQRRYRTERPYGCDQCNARFTLRSNMDRHVKQQHPDTYNQKPRIGLGKPQMFQEEDIVSHGPPNAKEEDLELIRTQDSIKEGYMSDEEEEEGYLEEEDDQNLIIDVGSNLHKHEDGQSFQNISQFFNVNQFQQSDFDHEACSESSGNDEDKKKSAYSATPHKMSCPVCYRKFPWSSSLKRHILTHTGQKPYKCTECPLWFTTKSNCDRHIQRKHGNSNGVNGDSLDRDSNDDNEEEGSQGPEDEAGFHFPVNMDRKETLPRRESISSPEAPYKCHICEDGFTDRDSAIEHIHAIHNTEYKELESKGAFDEAAEAPTSSPDNGEELYDQLRGKFPDYVNRKIICLFCSHKFWSAEDLRRHVRTHTGERPFSCDICSRRFTLKHSMLRHKKKHDSGVSSGGDGSDDDSVSNHSSYAGRSSPEQASNVNPPPTGLVFDKKRANLSNLMEKINRLNSAPDSL